MATLAQATASNAKFSPKSQPVIVVMGGTSGIGEGIVRAFARHAPPSVGAHIIIVGRSQSAADAIIASLPVHPTSKYEFISLDCTSIRSVRLFAKGLIERPDVEKINYLILSQGAFPSFGAPETKEGISPSMALMFHSRYRAALDLAPLLNAAAELGEDARILTIMNAGVGGPIDLSDLPLKRMRITASLGTMSTYTDICTLELAKRIPRASVTHVYPGAVKSGFGRSFPRVVQWLAAPMNLFMISAVECGEWMVYALLDPESKTGAHFKRGHGQHVEQSKYADEKAREAVWKFVEEKSDVPV
ncbi:NAD(P)-binding protein [Exidia glandulosa HHB12029]|uniref:NAD(P)-binding protein n=1 Tax=Exidia glandulosa HHB12029 TaxID=1314781 RepID=A0A165NJD4_EXIGL|nr:NAD(P)-binding protein [Exidia glandulosa HHB12029]